MHVLYFTYNEIDSSYNTFSNECRNWYCYLKTHTHKPLMQFENPDWVEIDELCDEESSTSLNEGDEGGASLFISLRVYLNFT